MFLKKLFSHSLIYALGPQIPKIAGLFVLPLITRYLDSTDYGVYGIITSYVGLLGATSDLGFSVLLVNSYFKYPDKWQHIWRQLHFLLQAWSVVYGILLGILLYFTMPDQAEKNLLWVLVLVCVPAIFFNPLQVIGSRYFQFAQKPLYMATTSAIVGVVAIFLNLYTIAVLKMGYMGWFVSSAIATFVQYLFFAIPMLSKHKIYPKITFRKKFIATQLRVSLPTIPHNYSSFLLNSSDRIVMDRLKLPVVSIGQYNLAYMFGNYFEFFSISVGMAVGPFYTKLIAKKTERHEKDIYFITHWLQYGFLLLGFVICLWCKELLDLLIKNDTLKTVYPIAIIIIMSYVHRPYYWLVVNKLQYDEKTSEFWKISFVAGVLNLIFNIILIPIFGVMAAAITTFFALMYMNFAGFFLKSFKRIQALNYHPIQMIGLVLVSTTIVYLLKDTSAIIKVVISSALIVAFLSYTWKRMHVFKAIEV